MGRYNLAATRVHKTVTSLLESQFLRDRPPWYDTIGSIPPAAILTRPQPVQHRALPKRLQNKKPSKMFKPQQIIYEEDKLRMNFFKDHPWELARPRVILEQDGKDGQKVDWSRIQQPGRPLNGESVVQRQLWLLNNVEGMTSARAYDLARHEFYELRHQEEIESRVAKEEAMAMGANFGMSIAEVSMQLEDASYDRWLEEATKNIAAVARQRAAAYSGVEDPSPEPKNNAEGVDDMLLTPEEEAELPTEAESLGL